MKVGSIPELEKAISSLLERLRSETQADAVTFHYYDETNDRLVLPVGVGLKQTSRFKSWLPSMDRVAGKIVRATASIFADDAEHGETSGPFVYTENVKSSAGLPLITKAGDKIGVLFVNYRTPHQFPPEEKACLEGSAVQIADAIREWLTQSPNLKAELKALAGRRREEAALQDITEAVRETLGSVAVAMWTLEKRINALTIVAQSGLEELAARKARLDLAQSTSVTDAFRTGRPRHGDALEGKPFAKKRAEEMRLKAVWAFPIRSQSRPVGVLCIYPIGYSDLTPHERTIARMFAEQAAATIENHRRILAMTALHDVGARLTFASAEPQQLIQEIVASAARVMQADSIAIHQYDPIRRTFYGFDKSVTYGEIKPFPKTGRPREDGVSAHIVKHGIIRVEDMDEAEPGFIRTRRVLSSGVKAYLGIRLKADEDVVGVLFINYNEPRESPFSPDEVTVARIFADYASIAIRNARMYKEANDRVKDLDVLGGVGRALTSGIRLHEDEVLELIHAQASEIMDTNNMYIALYDEATDTVRFPLAFVKGKRVDVEKEEGWQPRKAGKGRTEEIVRTRQPIFIVAEEEAKAWYAQPGREEYIGTALASWLGVPMMVGEKVLGVIATYHPTQDYVYTEDDLELLQAMADQAAIALDNARLYYDVNCRLESLVKVSRELTAGLRLTEGEILRLIHSQASELMDTNNMYIALYDEATDAVRFPLAFVNGKRADVEKEEGWQPRKAGRGRTEEIVRTRQPIFIVAEEEAKAWYAQPGREEYTGGPIWSSWLGVPMAVGGRVLGVIATYHPTEEHVYTEDDLELLQAMADQAAIALDNARMFNKVEALVEFTQGVTSADRMRQRQILNEEQVLELIYEQIGRLMNTDNMSIALYDEAKDAIRFPLAMRDGERVDTEREPGWTPRPGLAGKGKTNEIIRTRKPILLSTRAEEDEWYAQEEERERTVQPRASYLGVPMMIGDRVLGVIDIYHLVNEYEYTGGDLAVLQDVANQAAVALDSTLSYARAEKRRSQLETVRGVTNVISAELELQECLERILDETMALLGAHYATIQLVDETTDELVIHAQKGVEGKKLESEFHRIRIGEGVTGRAAQTGYTIRAGNVKEFDYYLDYIVEGTQSEMATPLMEGGKVIGVLNVEDPREDAFDEDDENLFRLLAEQVVVAVQNARRVEALREEQRRREEAEKFEYLGILAGAVAHRVGGKGGLIRLHVNKLRELIPPESDEVYAILDKIERDNGFLIEMSEALFLPAEAAETPLGLVDVNQLINQALRRADIPPDVEVSFEAGSIPRANGNRFLVDVFVELISNAVRAMAECDEKRLAISSQPIDETTIAVVCEDTGCGIAPEEMPRLFTLFYARPTDDETSGRGGYGLWYSKSIVMRMGGDLQIESEEGKGAKCTVLLSAVPV